MADTAEHFTHTFFDSFPVTESQQDWLGYRGQPLLDEVVAELVEDISELEIFAALPDRNKKLILDMAGFSLAKANQMDHRWRENFWGLYIVGSRARGEARPDSDLDLLSVGTFFRDQGYAPDFSYRDEEPVFDGFDLVIPDKLPDSYNVGDVDRKYLIRATPTEEGVLPVDLNVVDLTFWDAALDSFKQTLDIDEDGSELVRVPLFELTVPIEEIILRR